MITKLLDQVHLSKYISQGHNNKKKKKKKKKKNNN